MDTGYALETKKCPTWMWGKRKERIFSKNSRWNKKSMDGFLVPYIFMPNFSISFACRLSVSESFSPRDWALVRSFKELSKSPIL